MVGLGGVLLLGIVKGVLLAVVVSLLLLLATAARPHVAFLGRIPGTRRYSDLDRHPDNELIPGVLVFRAEASLLYFNVEHVIRRAEVAHVQSLRRAGAAPLVRVRLTVMLPGATMLAALNRQQVGCTRR